MIFSDEKKFNLDGPDGWNYYWRDLRQDPRIFSKRNFGGGNVMCWAAFSSLGKLDIVFVNNKMNSNDYQQVLDANLVPFIRQFPGQNLIYQQDNASIHVSRSTMAWFTQKNIEVLDWPSCSPDLNPMENMWGILAKHVYANSRQFSTVADLKQVINTEWQSISAQTCKNLVDSMNNRIFQLIQRNGAHTDY